jgi:hypothetical protein
VGVCPREVRRAREQRRVPGARRLPVVVVAKDELLVEDLRIKVAPDLHVRPKQGGEYATVLAQVGVVLPPLHALERLLWGFPGPRHRRDRNVGRPVALERRAQVVLLQKERHADAPPARRQDRLSDRVRVELLHGDVELALGAGDELDDHSLQIVSAAEAGRADVRLDLAVSEVGHLR